MTLAIIIVSYNSQKQLLECLDSIENSSWKGNLKIIIVDNNSQDQTLKFLNEFSAKKNLSISLIKNSQNLGFAKAVNQALTLAQEKFAPDYFLLLNPDALLEKNCLEKLLYQAQANAQLGLLSAKILNPKNQSTWFAAGQIHWLSFNTSHCLEGKPTEYLTGCCLLIKKAVVEKVGLLDERFFLYYEDADFSLRTQNQGFQLAVAADALCYHEESQSSTSKFKTYNLVKNGLLFFYKHYPFYLRPYFWLAFGLRFCYHRFFSHKTIVKKALQDFLKSQ